MLIACCCISSIVVTRYTAAHSAYRAVQLAFSHLLQWLFILLSVFFLYALFNCLELHQEIRVSFCESKTGLSPLVVFLLTVPRQFICCSSSLCAGGLTVLGWWSGVSITLCCFVGYSTRRFVLPCVFFFFFFFLFFVVFFSVLLALRLPGLGKRELILVFFVRLFDLRLFWFYLFPLPHGVWEGLRLVNVAFPGLLSYLSYMWRLFCHNLYFVYPSFGVSGGLCFLIVTFFIY